MKRIVDSEAMKIMDTYTIDKIGIPAMVLMERAALAVCRELENPVYDLSRVLVLCGSGNNGGDGLAIARLLTLKGVAVDVLLCGNQEHETKSRKKQRKIARKCGVQFVQEISWTEYTTIVDAIFGVGLNRKIQGNYASLIKQVNQSRARVVAVDIPSGVSTDNGAILGCAIHADTTVTFAFQKSGLLLYPGTKYAGRVLVEDIGILEVPSTDLKHLYSLENSDLTMIPARMDHSNKGTYGKVLVIAGSDKISGAAYLSALAAFRVGAGMVKIYTSDENREVLQQLLPEAMVTTYHSTGKWNEEELKADMEWADVIGAGPGIGTEEIAETIVKYVLTHNQKPLVLDADALNIISVHPDWLEDYHGLCILTPHLGEMARLLHKPIKEFADDLVSCADEFADNYKVTVVLKDARTVTAVEGRHIYMNTSGNNGMSTAGSGDVLTGMILGLLGRRTPFDIAAALGVFLHGKAGDAACEKKGASYMMASDMIEALKELNFD